MGSIDDLSNKLEFLGQPFKTGLYARNVWDMQLFDNKIYLGHGNSSNSGPTPNAGPIPVIYYDIANSNFVTQYTVDEEQINIYKVINGLLTIPGHDSRGQWNYGNYYFLENNTWRKISTLPKAVHVYDMINYNSKLYAAVGTDGFSEVLVSIDNGTTWNSAIPSSGPKFVTCAGRAYCLFQQNGLLFASSCLSGNASSSLNNLLKIDQSTSNVIKFSSSKFIPEAYNTTYKMIRTQNVNGKLLFINAFINNDHQYIPDLMYCSSEIGISKEITLPDPYSVPIDILIRDTISYVLAYKKISSNNYINYVFSSNDQIKWTEVLRFTQPTFSRSFEEVNGDFYFGLGCDYMSVSDSTGKILRIRK